MEDNYLDYWDDKRVKEIVNQIDSTEGRVEYEARRGNWNSVTHYESKLKGLCAERDRIIAVVRDEIREADRQRKLLESKYPDAPVTIRDYWFR